MLAVVEDEALLQMGVGAIPNAVPSRLHDCRDLGIHTKMCSSRLVDLVASGAIINRHRVLVPIHSVTTCVSGSMKIVDSVDDTPAIR